MVVNGTIGAFHEVNTEQVRLRILNGAHSRVFNFGLDDQREFAQIGSDGGLLPQPHLTDAVQLSPGERAEIVVPGNPGERTTLLSQDVDPQTDFWSQRISGGDDSFDVLQLRAAETLEHSPELPEQLAPALDLESEGVQTTRSFDLGVTTINGLKMDMARIDEVVEVDTTEVREVANPGNLPHNFHGHDVQFQVLAIDGRAAGPELSGWKDTVYIAPNTTTNRIALRFTDYADPYLPYMFHCHLLRHEDLGMMGQFLVVEPGQQPGDLPDTDLPDTETGLTGTQQNSRHQH